MAREKKQKNKQSKFAIWWRWPLIVLVLSFFLSLAFGLVSEIALSGAAIAVSVVVIVVFLTISYIGDMVGVAITAANFQPFRAMAARKVRGAKEAIKLIQNREKVASVCADVIGDICGILSGAAGASIAVVIISKVSDSFLEVFIASLISAVIAALTIFGKAYFKKYSIVHNEKIILWLGKFVSLFRPQHKKQDKKSEKLLKNNEKLKKNSQESKELEILEPVGVVNEGEEAQGKPPEDIDKTDQE